MNNIANSYFDYIGATGIYSTTDYIDYTTSNTSNILNNKIDITSNILETYTDNSINILDNKYNKLIKEEIEQEIINGIPLNIKNTYITNSNLGGQIKFYMNNLIDYNVPVFIDREGFLQVYYKYDGTINLLEMSGYKNIVNEISSSKANINLQGAYIATLQLETAGIISYLIKNRPQNEVGELLEQPAFITTSTYSAITTGLDAMSVRLQNILFNNSFTLFLGTPVAIGLFLAAQAIAHNDAATIVGQAIIKQYDSNSGLTAQEKQNLLIYGSNLYAENINKSIGYTSNLNILSGFINSNILTSQKIPNITTSNISVSNTGSTTYSTINFTNATNNSTGYIGLGGIVSGYHNNNIVYNTPKAHIFNVPGQSSLSIPAFSINASACVGININPSAYPLYRFSVDGDVYIHNAALRTNSIIYSGTELSTTLNNYLLKSGGTMTGTLTTNSIIYNSQELSTTLNNYLLLSGGTLTDTIIFNTGLFDNPSPSPQGFNGDRIVLQAGIGTNGYPYSIGINTNIFWFSSPSTSSYKFYSGATNTATLNNTGLLTLPSINATTSITTNSIIYNSQELSTTLTDYLLKAGGTMNGRIVFNTGYYQDPSPTGFGDRIVLQSGGLGYPYSVGINTDVFWFSSPSTSSYKFYSGAINTATLNNTGLLTLPSINATTSITSAKINVADATPSSTTFGRLLNVVGNEAVMRIWRNHSTSSPAVELIWGPATSGSSYTWYWDFWIGAGAGVINNFFAIRDRKGGGGVNRLIIDDGGNVGIGTTTNSSYKLNVTGALNSTGNITAGGNVGIGTPSPYTQFHMRSTNPILTIMSQGGVGATSTINLSPYDTATNAGACSLIATDAGSFGATFQIRQKLAGANTNGQFTSFIMNVDGNVGIGTTTLTGIKLYVGGKATFQDIITLPNSQWNKSADGIDRFYYNPNGTTFFHSGNSDPAFVFRSFAQSDIVTISNSGNIAGNAGTFGGNIDCGGCLFLTGSNSIYNPGGATVDSGNYSNTYLTFKANVAGNDWCHIRQVGSDNFFKLALDFHDDGDDARFCIRNVKSTDTPDTITEVFSVNNGNVACTGNLIVNDITRSRNYFNFGTTLNYQTSYNGYNAGGWYFPLNQFWDGYSTVSYIHIAITCLGINSVWCGRALVGQGGGLYFLTSDFRNPSGTNQIDVYDIWGGSYNALRITINNGTYAGQFNIKISG